MKKQWVASAAFIALLLGVGLLWLRVRNLESIVNSLQQPHPLNSTIKWNKQPPNTTEEEDHVFKLLDYSTDNPGTTKVGVPWNVEKAMQIRPTSQPERRVK